MNDNDQQNLEFLLAVDSKVLASWWEQTSEDDRLYASELLEEYSHQLLEKELSLMQEYPDAAKVIARLR